MIEIVDFRQHTILLGTKSFRNRLTGVRQRKIAYPVDSLVDWLKEKSTKLGPMEN